MSHRHVPTLKDCVLPPMPLPSLLPTAPPPHAAPSGPSLSCGCSGPPPWAAAAPPPWLLPHMLLLLVVRLQLRVYSACVWGRSCCAAGGAGGASWDSRCGCEGGGGWGGDGSVALEDMEGVAVWIAVEEEVEGGGVAVEEAG